MRAMCVVVILVAGSVAWAGKKTLVIAAGECADPSLISGAKDFRDTASRLLGPQLMEAEVVLDIVRPRATRSLQDIERQIDSARALFYGGQADRAEGLIDRALDELDRASPESKPWPATQNALVLKALIAKSLDRPKDMADAFRRIARIEPSFKLDPDAHPPSAIAALEAVKKELSRARRSPVLVRVDAGPVATVYVDGQPMGATPLKLELPPGTYRVALTSGGMVSFPHRLDLPKDVKLGIDLAFEGSIGTQAPLCLSGAADAPAVKLAQLVAAENVIILRNVGKRAEPPYLQGTVYDLASGQQERSGSVQPELLSNLATFLVTGKEMMGVAKAGGEPSKPVVIAPMPVEKKVEAKVEPKKVDDAPVAAPLPPTAVPLAQQPTFEVKNDSNPGRAVSFTLIGLGVALAVGGAVAFAAGTDDRDRLEGISPGGLLPSQTINAGKESLPLMTRIDTNTTASLALMAGGGGAILSGVIGVLLFPAGDVKLSAGPTAQGASMLVQGKF